MLFYDSVFEIIARRAVQVVNPVSRDNILRLKGWNDISIWPIDY